MSTTERIAMLTIGLVLLMRLRGTPRNSRRRGTRRRVAIARAEIAHVGYPSTYAMRRALSLDTIYARDGGRCGICGGRVERYAVGQWAPQLDHIVPIARGGEHSARNLQLSHAICNQRKGGKRR